MAIKNENGLSIIIIWLVGWLVVRSSDCIDFSFAVVVVVVNAAQSGDSRE